MRLLIACVMLVAGTSAHAQPSKKKPKCSRVIAKQVKARELKLVGVVMQGTRRKIMLVDRGGQGHVVVPGECAGREQVPFDEWLAPLDDSVRVPQRLIAAR